MNPPSPLHHRTTLSLSQEEQIDRLSDEFEGALQAGETPRIEDYLLDLSDPVRPVALRELLEIEVEHRCVAGEPIDVESYRVRFADQRDVVDAVALKLQTSRDNPALAPTMDAAGQSSSQDAEFSGGSGSGSQQEDPGAGAPPLPRLSDRYKILGHLGSGAFGRVVHAYDQELDRDVAIKTLHPKHQATADAADRFREEARRAAALDHPHIVPVYDVGVTADGQLYVVSKMIEGGSLKARIESKTISRDEAVEVIATLADALNHAHQKGLVHRDVKPENVLLDAQGRPLLADFGLALHEDEQRQRRNELSGSPPYMAPEQTRGKSQHLDGRTDIWALGVMLYEMLTGRQPFGGKQLSQLFEEIREREPKPPRQIDGSIPEALQDIVLKCLAKPIPQRYATAGDLADELRRWQDEPVPERSGLSSGTGYRQHVLPVALALAGMLTALGLVMKFGPSAVDSSPDRDDLVDPVIPAPPAAGLLTGDISLAVVRDGESIPVEHPRARPVRPGDGIQVHAELDQPAYLYLVWIDESGQATPFYPSTSWHDFAAHEMPAKSLVLPEAGRGYYMESGTGMQTVLMLARTSPLPDGEQLRDLFAGLPQQTLQDERALVYWDEGSVSERANRAPDFFKTVRIEDPVLETQQILEQRLQDDFPLMRAVSVAVQAGSP